MPKIIPERKELIRAVRIFLRAITHDRQVPDIDLYRMNVVDAACAYVQALERSQAKRTRAAVAARRKTA